MVVFLNAATGFTHNVLIHGYRVTPTVHLADLMLNLEIEIETKDI